MSASGLAPVVAPDHDDDPDLDLDDKVMTLVDHLSELRLRIVISIVAVTIGTVVGFYFSSQIIDILRAPVGETLFFTSPGGAFFIRLKLGLMVGVALASPVVLYQLWAFVSPGLTPRERRAARPWVPLAIVFLLLGVGVAYLTLPYTVAFLLSFQVPGVIEPLITVESYFGFVTTLFIVFGLVMQFPIVIVLLSKVGIVDVDRLRGARRYVFVAIFVIAVVVTPGGDPISPTIMAAVMYPLYELTIWLVGRNNRKSA
ncbi:MAG: twin-arginine translocase subunit TatC [Candidatus Limnocylindrales bacterium]